MTLYGTKHAQDSIMRTEVWRAIPGFEGFYEVSDHGQVRSLDRMRPTDRQGRCRGRNRGRLLKQRNSRGYRVLDLWNRDRVVFHMSVHALVLMAFVGPRPDDHQCCHRDGNRANNRVENLYWGTRSENELDKVRHGTHRNSKRTHCNSGHLFDEKNTGIKNGYRYCRRCNRASANASYHRRKRRIAA